MNVLGQPNFSINFPESLPTDCIEGLGQVNEGRIEVTLLFHTFLLELTGGKDRVGGSSTCAEAALTLREVTLFQVIQQAVEYDTGQDLACYGQDGYSSVVVAGLAVSFSLVDVNDCGTPEFL